MIKNDEIIALAKKIRDKKADTKEIGKFYQELSFKVAKLNNYLNTLPHKNK